MLIIKQVFFDYYLKKWIAFPALVIMDSKQALVFSRQKKIGAGRQIEIIKLDSFPPLRFGSNNAKLRRVDFHVSENHRFLIR